MTQLYNFENFANYTKANAKSFESNTNVIEDLERTKYEHYLNNLYKEDEAKEEALDYYYSSLEHEEENED